MKKILFLILILCSSSAFAKTEGEGFYTRFDVGTSYGVEKGIDNGEVFKLGFGQRVADFWRFEFTTSFFQNHLSGNTHDTKVHGKISSRSIIGNVYLDIPVCDRVVPFIFGGVGLSMNRISQAKTSEVSFERERKYGTVWQVGTGLGIKVHSNFMIDLTYAYTNLGKFKINPTTEADSFSRKARVQQGIIGVRYLFDEK